MYLDPTKTFKKVHTLLRLTTYFYTDVMILSVPHCILLNLTSILHSELIIHMIYIPFEAGNIVDNVRVKSHSH